MLKVVKVKGCRRCGGDLFLERDSDGVYLSCLQCGAVYASSCNKVMLNMKKVPERGAAACPQAR